jgi:hypothetical protein
MLLIPAKAGIQTIGLVGPREHWIPVFAGRTLSSVQKSCVGTATRAPRQKKPDPKVRCEEDPRALKDPVP